MYFKNVMSKKTLESVLVKMLAKPMGNEIQFKLHSPKLASNCMCLMLWLSLKGMDSHLSVVISLSVIRDWAQENLLD